MLTLLLMRHAKSDWDHPGLDDHDRPLSPRGLHNAPLMGTFIKDQGLLPGMCLTSTAIRARQTANLALEAMEIDIPLTSTRGLYNFGEGDAISRIITDLGKSTTKLMVIAHNPAIQGFATGTVGSGDEAALALLHDKYPTCSLAQIEYDMSSWADISNTKGTLKAFTTPNMLG